MEQFEGKVIKFTSCDGDEYEGLIVGYDYDIGITIVNAKDKERYLYCLLGPSSHPELYNTDRVYNLYSEVFEETSAMFKDGFYDRRIMNQINEKHNARTDGSPSAASCAFNK